MYVYNRESMYERLENTQTSPRCMLHLSSSILIHTCHVLRTHLCAAAFFFCVCVCLCVCLCVLEAACWACMSTYIHTDTHAYILRTSCLSFATFSAGLIGTSLFLGKFGACSHMFICVKCAHLYDTRDMRTLLNIQGWYTSVQKKPCISSSVLILANQDNITCAKSHTLRMRTDHPRWITNTHTRPHSWPQKNLYQWPDLSKKNWHMHILTKTYITGRFHGLISMCISGHSSLMKCYMHGHRYKWSLFSESHIQQVSFKSGLPPLPVKTFRRSFANVRKRSGNVSKSID